MSLHTNYRRSSRFVSSTTQSIPHLSATILLILLLSYPLQSHSLSLQQQCQVVTNIFQTSLNINLATTPRANSTLQGITHLPIQVGVQPYCCDIIANNGTSNLPDVRNRESAVWIGCSYDRITGNATIDTM
jgi:hypothetical protein